MNAGKAVYGILSANSGVTDIVGTNIFPEIAEQETAVPFVVYQLQSVDPDDTHDGPSKLDEVRFEFLCYADSYNAAADLGVAVRAALDRVSGTYNGVHVESIQFNDVDVNIEYDPRRYSQVLTFTFRIKRDDVTIALGTPVTGAVLGDLSDVDVTGVTNGQLIAYNSTSGNWEAANDAGGANELSDLSDANVSLPSDGEVLIYSGGEFVNDNIAISNVTGLQAALDAAPDNLRELTDVTISGLADNDYLQYDSASGTWQNSTLIVGRNGQQYTGNYDSEAETLLDGATETVELYYTAQADGDGLHEDAQSNTPSAGNVIRRKLWYAEKAQADPNTSGDWTQFADIADDTAYATAKATLLAYLKARTGGTVPISLKMTWEDVAATSYLLDDYSGAAAAYSLRLLSSTYSGDAVEVYNGTSYADIGFADGELDTTALATHCGSNDGFVSKFYDQSGNSNTAAQTTTANMPKIYDGTTGVVTRNGKPFVMFSTDLGGSPHFQTSHSFTTSVNNEIMISTVYEATTDREHIFEFNNIAMTANYLSSEIMDFNGANCRLLAKPTQGTALSHVLMFADGTDIKGRANGAAYATDASDPISGEAAGVTTSTTQVEIGRKGNGFCNESYIAELILYPSYSAIETGLESNINTFYDIY